MSEEAPHDFYQSVLITCFQCNAHGALTTKRADGSKTDTFVCIAGEFHSETGRTVPDGTVIVCDQCDEIYGILPAVDVAH